MSSRGLMGFVWMLLLAALSSSGQSLSWKADTNALKIGEQVQIEVQLSDAEGYSLPVLTDTIGPFEVVRSSAPDTLSTNPWVVFQRYQVTTFDTGYIAIQPAYASRGTDTLLSEGLFFEVRNPEEIPDEITEIHPPVDAPKTTLEWLTDLFWYGLLPLASIAALYYLWKRYRNRDREPKPVIREPELSASEWVRQAFAIKRAEAFYNTADSKQYYDEMTDLLREFIGREHGISAMEMVTSELHNELRDRSIYTSDLELLLELLQRADRAKFARGTLTLETHRQDFDRMEELILKWTDTETHA